MAQEQDSGLISIISWSGLTGLYRIHDPQALVGSDKWFYNLQLGSGQLQLGINYPF